LLMEIAAGTDYNSFIVPMETGFHAIRFEYVHKKGGKDFGYSYIPPGASTDGPILPAVMYYGKE